MRAQQIRVGCERLLHQGRYVAPKTLSVPPNLALASISFILSILLCMWRFEHIYHAAQPNECRLKSNILCCCCVRIMANYCAKFLASLAFSANLAPNSMSSVLRWVYDHVVRNNIDAMKVERFTAREHMWIAEGTTKDHFNYRLIFITCPAKLIRRAWDRNSESISRLVCVVHLMIAPQSLCWSVRICIV